jgi:hypothetical protein
MMRVREREVEKIFETVKERMRVVLMERKRFIETKEVEV